MLSRSLRFLLVQGQKSRRVQVQLEAAWKGDGEDE